MIREAADIILELFACALFAVTILILAALYIGVVQAAEITDANGNPVTSLFVLQPPERFTHYDGPVVEHVLPLFEAMDLCGKRVGPAFACQWYSTDGCHIVLPRGGFGSVEAYRRHERAHCAGWSNWHEGARL